MLVMGIFTSRIGTFAVAQAGVGTHRFAITPSRATRAVGAGLLVLGRAKYNAVERPRLQSSLTLYFFSHTVQFYQVIHCIGKHVGNRTLSICEDMAPNIAHNCRADCLRRPSHFQQWYR